MCTNNLSVCYQNGTGINKNEKKAFECYINEGDLCAQYNLGICYQNGTGISKSEKEAFERNIRSRNITY